MDPSFLQLMVENVPDLVWAKDMEDRYLYVNRAVCSVLLHCRTPVEAAGKTDDYFAQRERRHGHIHTFDQNGVASDRIVRQTGKPGRFVEEGFVRGRYLVLDIHKAPLFDENQQIIGTVGSGRDITREKMFETRLKQAHDQFTRVMDHLNSGVYVVEDQSRELLFVNETAAGYFHKQPKDIIGRRCWQVFQKERQTRPCRWCRHDADPQEKSKRFQCLDRILERDFEVVQRPIEWPDGRRVTLTITTDITRQKQFLEALEKSESRFREMADFLPVPILEVERDHRISYANRTAMGWFGISKADIQGGYGVSSIVAPDRVESVLTGLNRFFNGKPYGPRDMCFITQNGEERYGMIYPAPIRKDGQVVKLLGCFLDLTQRRQAEAALQDSEARFRALFNNFQDAIFLHPYEEDGFGIFREVNDMACRRYGYSRSEFLTMTPAHLNAQNRDCLVEGKDVRHEILRAGRQVFEAVHRKKNGEKFPVEISASVLDYQGRQFFLSLVRDIT
ncbi:MAG: PAS domain S-box protein, partial [Desulfobacterales bacterium]|nr:PAS domain S-box protein [Desulfobacterales bacterium]